MPARTEPLDATGTQDELSLRQIRDEKESRRRELFEEQDGVMRAKGEDTSSLPWLRSVVGACRGSCLFRACVAREPETPLTELHLMQPVLGVLLLAAVVMMIVTAAAIVGILRIESAGLRGVEIACAALAAFSSVCFLYAGRIAHGVPSHEQLNVALNKRVDWLADSVEDVTADADDAERLEGMTLGWVKARGADRDAVRRINAQLKTNTERLWAFRFKARLLRYLSRGERQRYQSNNAQLLLALRETPGATLAEYESGRDKLLPNGRLTREELRHVADVVRQTEQGSAYDFLDEVIYALCDDFGAVATEHGLSERHTWSYAELVEAVYARASLPPYAERFAKYSQEETAQEEEEEDSGVGPAPLDPPPSPPSPPPSPPNLMKGVVGASAAIGIFVFIETQKPLLLRNAWKAAALTTAVGAVLLIVAVSTGGGAEVVSFIAAVVAVAASLIGWWVCICFQPRRDLCHVGSMLRPVLSSQVCNNKKDDLVMQRAVARLEEQLHALDAAEQRLRSALDTMIACDTDMSALTADIAAATGEAEAQLEAIRAHNERAIKGTRRSVLDIVLVDLADVDGTLFMAPGERRKLLRLMAHMAGREVGELRAFHDALGLCVAGGGGACAADDEREYSTREVLDALESLGAFEIIMGLDVDACAAPPPEGRRLVQRDSWVEPSLPQALKARRAQGKMGLGRFRRPQLPATSTRAVELLPLSGSAGRFQPLDERASVEVPHDEAHTSVCDDAC